MNPKSVFWVGLIKNTLPVSTSSVPSFLINEILEIDYLKEEIVNRSLVFVTNDEVEFKIHDPVL